MLGSQTELNAADPCPLSACSVRTQLRVFHTTFPTHDTDDNDRIIDDLRAQPTPGALPPHPIQGTDLQLHTPSQEKRTSRKQRDNKETEKKNIENDNPLHHRSNDALQPLLAARKVGSHLPLAPPAGGAGRRRQHHDAPAAADLDRAELAAHQVQSVAPFPPPPQTKPELLQQKKKKEEKKIHWQPPGQ